MANAVYSLADVRPALAGVFYSLAQTAVAREYAAQALAREFYSLANVMPAVE
jgi:hypothetical protein